LLILKLNYEVSVERGGLWNVKVKRMLGDEIFALQTTKLKKQIKYCYDNSPPESNGSHTDNA